MEEVLSRGRTTTAREPGALGLKDGRKDFREKDPKGLGGGGGGRVDGNGGRRFHLVIRVRNWLTFAQFSSFI